MFYILLLITAFNIYTAIHYIMKLEKEYRNKVYIYSDAMHSLQHIAITGMSMILSISMLFGDCSSYTELVYIFYNASLAFIIYPHLQSEE